MCLWLEGCTCSCGNPCTSTWDALVTRDSCRTCPRILPCFKPTESQGFSGTPMPLQVPPNLCLGDWDSPSTLVRENWRTVIQAPSCSQSSPSCTAQVLLCKTLF